MNCVGHIQHGMERELTLREALAFLIEREIARTDERRVAMAVEDLAV